MNPKYTLSLMLAGILTLGVGDVAGVVVPGMLRGNPGAWRTPGDDLRKRFGLT